MLKRALFGGVPAVNEQGAPHGPRAVIEMSGPHARGASQIGNSQPMRRVIIERILHGLHSGNQDLARIRKRPGQGASGQKKRRTSDGHLRLSQQVVR